MQVSAAYPQAAMLPLPSPTPQWASWQRPVPAWRAIPSRHILRALPPRCLVLADFREFTPVTVAGKEVVSVEDYKESVHTDLTNDSTKVIDLPKSNVLKYTLSDGSWFVLRPSGTEPKAKVYIGVIADVIDAADAQVAKIKEDVLARVNEIIA